jgi:hypothetical protein
MSNADWYSRRLQSQTPPTPQRSATPPVSPPVRFPVQVPVQQQAVQPAPANANLLDPRRAPSDQIPMGEALRLWQGGEATRREGNLSCPSCGSHLVFSRSKGGISGHAPAPRCFSCGYNGLYDQGDQANWAV